MVRKTVFWLHLVLGVTAGLFIFIMAATGVLLAFERQVIELVDGNIRSVSNPQDVKAQPLASQLQALRRSGLGNPTAIVLANQAQAATQFSVGRGKTVYLDPFSSAVLGVSSVRAHQLFSVVENVHRTLGEPFGSRSTGRWLTGVSNLLFAALILPGIILWLPRNWNAKALRASSLFRMGLIGRARHWNWHNVIGIWCALPLLVISLTGVVMSFQWANALLFRMAGSAQPAFSREGGERGRHVDRDSTAANEPTNEPNYDRLFTAAKNLDPAWRTIALNIARDANGPISVSVDTGSAGQPQKRTQYLLNRDNGLVERKTTFADGSLGQRLRAFVRFGHTGEYGGWVGQAIAALASFGACVLVYTGLSLSVRRLFARLRRNRHSTVDTKQYAEQTMV